MQSIFDTLMKKKYDEIFNIAFRLMAEPPEKQTRKAWAEAVVNALQRKPREELHPLLSADAWSVIREELRPHLS